MYIRRDICSWNVPKTYMVVCEPHQNRQAINEDKPKDLTALANALKAAVAAKKSPEQAHVLPAYVPCMQGKGDMIFIIEG